MSETEMQRNVLFVDDDSATLDLYRSYFSGRESIVPVVASSADRAQSVLQEEDIDCIVSDGVRTDDGELFVEYANRSRPDLPVVLCSGNPPSAAPDVDAVVRKDASSDQLTTLAESVSTLLEENDSPVESRQWRSLGTLGTECVSSIPELIAEDTGRDIDDLPRLYDAIDPDAFLRLLASATERRTEELFVQFRYGQYLLGVSGDGRVVYRPADGPTEGRYIGTSPD